MPVEKRRTTTMDDEHLELAVDWTPAYELLIAFITYFSLDKHCIDELGTDWLPTVRANLPADFKPTKQDFKAKQDDALLARLIYGGPHHPSAAQWLEWLQNLSPGAAYEILQTVTPEH